jgi:hypothetical protein
MARLAQRSGRDKSPDAGPGNAPIDDWTLSQTGHPVGRALARAGRADAAHLARFPARAPPKSRDREDFSGFQPQRLSSAWWSSPSRSERGWRPPLSPAQHRWRAFVHPKRRVFRSFAPISLGLKPRVNHPFPLYR